MSGTSLKRSLLSLGSDISSELDYPLLLYQKGKYDLNGE
ncbi:hypothetical protein BN938_0054 [Mucinivorans hirudinis]|uniref:Uncharacterized protein n=1 Tax=Mucinivorans hirudinis TaxID=1433126 RepID=A0A060R5N5_9BACT|nr:hypothetical protein BN938_0054 [Mucinivorans hirudinis]